MMLEQAIKALESHKGVDDWLAREVRSESNQYYLAKSSPENRRSAGVERLEVTVYSDHPSAEDHAPSRGSASITLLPGDGLRAGERIADAVFMAGLTDNPPYGLPGPAVYPAVLTADRLLQVEPAGVATQLADQLLAALDAEPEVRLASAEFFVDRQETTLRNSRGIEAEQSGTSILVDVVLLARDAQSGHETESHIEVRRRALENLDLPAIVHQQARFASDTLRAEVPATGRFTVIVSGDALRDLLAGMFMSPLAFRSSARFKYEHLSPWEVGKSVFGDVEPTGDPLTVYANPTLPYGTLSYAFDSDGLPAQRLAVIEDGILQRFWATQRYAEYLHVPPTGEFGNLELVPGSMAVADMWEGEDVVYHIVAFSSMSPNPITGEFVGEIRLGYERRGSDVRPVKGGSLSGNILSDLARARLSQETTFLGNYVGPEAVRFPALTVSGA